MSRSLKFIVEDYKEGILEDSNAEDGVGGRIFTFLILITYGVGTSYTGILKDASS